MAEIRDNGAMRKVAWSIVTATIAFVGTRAADANPDAPQSDGGAPRVGASDNEQHDDDRPARLARHRRPWRALPMMMVAIGGTTIASGVAMIAMDQDPSPEGPRYLRNTAPQGFITVASGGVFAGIGGYLYWRYGRGPDVPSERSWVLPGVLMGGGATLVVLGTIWQVGMDPPNTFEQPRYLYNGPALATITAGGIAVCLGAYLGFKEPDRSSGPTVSLSGRGGTIGWTGTF